MENKLTAKRSYKDGVWRMLMGIPKNALSVYNALNNTDYQNPNELTYNTLENAIFMNIKNDVSFIVGCYTSLYEHQATYTPNMPLRDLFYVADVLQKYVKDQTLYSPARIRIPAPVFVVFYNGNRKMGDKEIQRLSDSYETVMKEPELELKVTILNINPGYNEELKRKSPILSEYTTFVETMRKYIKIMSIGAAAEQAVVECIRNDILKDFLTGQKAEVVKMSIYEYDEERELELIKEGMKQVLRDEVKAEVREEMREEVQREVREEVQREVREEVQREVREEVQREVREEIHEESVKRIILLCQKFTSAKEQAVDELINGYSLSRQEAEEKVALYWQ